MLVCVCACSGVCIREKLQRGVSESVTVILIIREAGSHAMTLIILTLLCLLYLTLTHYNDDVCESVNTVTYPASTSSLPLRGHTVYIDGSCESESG